RNKHDIIQWLKKADNYFQADLPEPYKYSSDTFRIEFDFVIKDSLIIRHYSSNPAESDSAHIRSEGKNIIPGSSIKGAMRSRAERILKTLAVEDQTELFSFLFGNSSTSDKDNGKRYDGSIPSRIKINEVIIKQKVEANIQQRIKIDRFTGGTIDGALFDSMPIFSANHDIANKLIVDLKDPIDAEIGLMLLILKDLWTEDLPIGGEKNIGRGILQGKKAVISYKNWSIVIDNIDTVSSENKNKLEKYLKALNDADLKDHMKVMRERYYMREAANE
ncbi:MAG TPA: hypothetical protein ENH23_02595, partial [candidate division Zixibacteria bacterium]|nr:hypothetical protein [candidate division Zixibacteria bacterium]